MSDRYAYRWLIQFKGVHLMWMDADCMIHAKVGGLTVDELDTVVEQLATFDTRRNMPGRQKP